MVSSNSFKFVMLPPQTDTTRRWAKRLAEAVPEVRVIVAEDADTAAREIVDAEAAFGWLGKELLLKVFVRLLEIRNAEEMKRLRFTDAAEADNPEHQRRLRELREQLRRSDEGRLEDSTEP